MSLNRLNRKVAVITGGGSGIGEATAKRMAAASARVVVVGRTKDKLDDTVASIEAGGGTALAVRADISEAGDMRDLYATVDDHFGRLDIVFAHAGINGLWAPIEEMEPDDWQKTIGINLTGTFLTVKYAVPMLKRQGGSIIITSSVNGTRMFSNSGASAYAASKAGQVAFMKMMALELAEAGVRVNAICPGSIESDIDERTTEQNTDDAGEPVRYPEGKVPLTDGCPGTPEQVADLVYFLASDASRHITGTPIWIDGAQSLLQG